MVLQQDELEPEAVRAHLEHVWDAKQRKLMCSWLRSLTRVIRHLSLSVGLLVVDIQVFIFLSVPDSGVSKMMHFFLLSEW